MRKLFVLVMVAGLSGCAGEPPKKKSAGGHDSAVPVPVVNAHQNRTDTIRCDTSIAGVTAKFRINYYSDNNVLIEEKFDEGDFGLYSFPLDRTFFPNGKLQRETIGEYTCCTGPEWDRTFDDNGNEISAIHEIGLDPLPGEGGEFNHPRVYHEMNYENGQLINEGDTYTNCGECDWDSAGTWKFYTNGKLTGTKKFPSWQSYYQKSGGKLK